MPGTQGLIVKEKIVSPHLSSLVHILTYRNHFSLSDSIFMMLPTCFEIFQPVATKKIGRIITAIQVTNSAEVCAHCHMHGVALESRAVPLWPDLQRVICAIVTLSC